MDSLEARIEALEQERAAGKRSLRLWKVTAAAAVAGALCIAPLAAQSEPGQGVPQQIAALQRQVAWLQTALDEKTAALETAVNNEATARQVASTTLQSQVTAVAAKLEKVSIQQIDGHYSIVIDGANLHLRNGLGATNGRPELPFSPIGITNGLGNLIVGYDETPVQGSDRRGSHNLVIGQAQNFTSFGGLLAGRFNSLGSPYASVSGGTNNLALGFGASVSGGTGNTASGAGASVSGGNQNTASGTAASVSGGDENTASELTASVSGGNQNTASGQTSSIGGGQFNRATGLFASITGGGFGTAGGPFAWVGGGLNNRALNEFASVSGGASNVALGARSSVSGGQNRQAPGVQDWVAGGLFQDL